jgi:hypothetical protein
VSTFRVRLYILYYLYFEPSEDSVVVRCNPDLTFIAQTISQGMYDERESSIETWLGELPYLYGNFIGEIKDSKEYLSHKQYSIVSNIISNTIITNIQYCMYLSVNKHILTEENFDKLMNLVADLNDSLKIKKKKTP